MEDFTHKFTETGLGKAPFHFTGCHENAFKLPDGTDRAGGSCDHCGTGIRWEFWILSSDGVRSKVGSDCISKAGDKGLINIARAEINKRNREKAQAKRDAVIRARLDAERERNGGLTDWELTEKQHADNFAVFQQAVAPAIELLEILANRLEDNRGGFRDGITKWFRSCDRFNIPSENALRIAAEILGKEAGRKNSAAFNAEFDRVTAIIEQAVDIVVAATEEG
jgi:hypothetical protein